MDQRWVERREERIEFIDSVTFRRHLVVEISSHRLMSHALESGLQTLEDLIIPVNFVIKGQISNCDILDWSGRRLPRLTSDQDSEAAQLALLAELDDGLWDMTNLTKSVRERLFKIALGTPRKEDMARLLDGRYRYQSIDYWDPPKGVGVDDSDPYLWSRVLSRNNVRFINLLSVLSSRYMLMTYFSPEAPVHLMEIQHAGTVEKSSKPWLHRTMEDASLEARAYTVSSGGVGFSQRDHVRIESPPGTIMTRNPRAREEGTSLERDSYRVSIDSNGGCQVASFYLKKESKPERGLHEFTIEFRAGQEGFLRPAMVCAVAITVVLALGAYFENKDGFLSRLGSNDAEPLVALIVTLPALFSLYFVRDGEHEVKGRLLAAPRFALALTALMMVQAVIIFISYPDSVLYPWVLGAVVSLISTTFIGFVLGRTLIDARETRRAQARSR